MVGACGVGVNVIDIAVALGGYLHNAVGHGYALSFALIVGLVEVAVLAAYGALKDERHAGVGGLNGLDERKEASLDFIGGGGGESVEDKSVDVGGGGKSLGKIGLELAVAAAAEAKELQAGEARKLGWIGHAGTAC